MAFDIKNIIKYYQNLLIIQYNNKERANAVVKMHIDSLIKDDIFCKVQDAYNLDKAVGKQLDIIGKYVGIDRFVSQLVEPTGSFFGMTSYSTLGTDTTVGFTDYANYDTDEGGFLGYDDLSGAQALNDTDYRFILKLRIVQNNANHSHASIDNGLFTFFGNGLIMSSTNNMTMVYFLDTNSVSTELALIAADKKVLPKPMGVRLNGIIKRTKKMFGFTNYNKTSISGNVTGFTNYTNGFTKEGECLTYDKVINF